MSDTFVEESEAASAAWLELLTELESKCPSVPTVTDLEFESRVLSKENLRHVVVVCFFARNCGYCHELSEVIELLAKAGFDVVKVDCGAGGQGSAERFAIGSYPSIVLFRGGYLRSVYSWQRTADALTEWITAFSN